MKIRLLVFLLLIGFSNQKCKDKVEEEFEPPVVEPPVGEIPEVQMYLTTSNATQKFALQEAGIDFPLETANYTITIDHSEVYQEIDGFGFAVTGGSALHLNSMSDAARAQLLNRLFATTGESIGISYIRISIGASDLDESVFSYNDLPDGETDEMQEQFSIEPDRTHLIPILKEILAINPDLKIMATPWSPPTWMKTNGSSKGGQLLEKYYDSYALYLAKYIEAMATENITIESMSVQNEPLHPGNNPSMSMSAEEQLAFIKTALGPTFEERNIDTKIILYDHNADRPDYPMTILADEEAYQYVDGSGFHLYGGDISALTQVRNAYPEKNIYFTEQWFGAPGNFSGDLKWHVRELIIGATRNWSKNVIEWNLSSDPNLEPYTDGGCDQCLGGITIDGDNVTYNAGYYVVAHASRYVRPGSIRILSNSDGDISNVAFKTEDSQVVLIVLNNGESTKTINVDQGDVQFSTVLDAGSVATYVWNE
ncbi:MAG: glycoside hydrolase family 30 beta sandwich domain-containing protein [Reichenbachiella sp.]|uniref:glycoside hydrolase family 30 protein n=1 Tax=Reichenbachiella sp. TaxID=2184521 RepID=UPI002966B831|nr:glycoside hydrolase family 30 beta sandwich domain-containing protein [Reichenbachiella sp.]MDW3211850.1 glycoside hydrolase family 30 beta sandwich domain-containing protein [Reichenbachiella sp.]